MRLEVFDIDKLRPSKLLTGQVSQLVNGRQMVGRSLVKLAETCRLGSIEENKEEAEEDDPGVGLTAHMGRGEWGSPGGPVSPWKGEGG